jgi:hypothetical protein
MGALPADEQDRDVSAEEIATWYTPKEACRYAARIVGPKNAMAAISRRLLAGQIECAATRSSLSYGRNGPYPDPNPSLIPVGYWRHMTKAGSDLWGVGDARFFLPSQQRGVASKTFMGLGVKLNPRDVHDALPSVPLEQEPEPTPSPPQDPPKVESSPLESSKSETDELVQKGPPVSEEHLKAWFDLYRRVYSGAVDTEATALASARGMFHGKSVSRDRIRALRGTQKRGRKETTAK